MRIIKSTMLLCMGYELRTIKTHAVYLTLENFAFNGSSPHTHSHTTHFQYEIWHFFSIYPPAAAHLGSVAASGKKNIALVSSCSIFRYKTEMHTNTGNEIEILSSCFICILIAGSSRSSIIMEPHEHHTYVERNNKPKRRVAVKLDGRSETVIKLKSEIQASPCLS